MPAIHSRLLSLPYLAAFALGAQTVPTTLNYQGRLTDNSPAQVPVNATMTMKFEIFDAATLGNSKWSETPAGGVLVVGGIFNVALGSTTPIGPTVFTGASSTRYLEITLNPGASQEILAPRQLITATGYANLAQNANSAVTASTATTATTVTNGVYITGSYADPAWITTLAGAKITGTVANASSCVNFSGSIAGDVTGTQAATVVGKIQGRPVAATAPVDGQLLRYNATSSQWEPWTQGLAMFITAGTDQSVGNGDYISLGSSSASFLRNTLVVPRNVVLSNFNLNIRANALGTFVLTLWIQPPGGGSGVATILSATIPDGLVSINANSGATVLPVTAGSLISARFSSSGGAIANGIAWSVEAR